MMRALIACAILVLSSNPASAQSTELGGMVGFTPSISLDRQASELEDVRLEGGVTFGISATRLLGEHWGFGGEWNQLFSGFAIETADASAHLYDINISHFLGYAMYRFGDTARKARPFAFGGAGMTLFSARDLESESKLSFALGGGLSYFVSKSLGIEGRVAYRPIMLNDGDAGDFCDAFGFCQSTLQQFELMAGVRVRF